MFVTSLICSQCGQPWSAPACGPTHAVIWAKKDHARIFTISRRVLARDFYAQWYLDRCKELHQNPNVMHRKAWEFAAINQAFEDNFTNCADKSIKCLGFGVGLEPLASYCAAKGAKVLATDKPEMGVWNGQYARFKGDIYNKEIVDEVTFRENVSFLPVDMANIPDKLLQGKFDFTWSCGSFEHIGGLEASLTFFCNQMLALKPGGIAAHTTEYNFGSNDETINAKDLVLFRKQDLERLDGMLRAQRDTLYSLDLRGGDLPEDSIIDEPPYTNPVHLSLRINGAHVSTSIILIAQRGMVIVDAQEETERCQICGELPADCDCTGGPQMGDPECTCYEAQYGHQPGCPYYA